jgi:uncharacterized protein (DUF433 family)
MQKPEYLNDNEFSVGLLRRDNAALHDDLETRAEQRHDLMHQSPRAWQTVIKSANVQALRLEQWFAECAIWGHEALQNAVEVDPRRRGGIPVLKGTRFTVGQTLAELAESAGVPEVAERFDLDETTIRELLMGLALLVDRPCR